MLHGEPSDKVDSDNRRRTQTKRVWAIETEEMLLDLIS